MTQNDLLDQEPSDTPEPMHATPEKPAQLPDKFWDARAGQIRIEALIKSYCELERRLTRAAVAQVDEADEPGQFSRDFLLAQLGRPDTPDQYEITCDHDYFKSDPDLNARLHELGFTQDQVQAVYDLAAEKLVPTILDLAADLQAERELARITDHFGGAEKWAAVARQLLAFGRAHLDPDLLAHLSRSYDGVRMLHDMMRARVTGGVPSGLGAAADDQGLEHLQKLMRDPKYWRDHDPALMAKVSDGFARIYGDS